MSDLKNLSEKELADRLTASLAGLVDSTEKSELQQLTHDLQTHQIELEMQNRELRKAQLELEDSRNRYADLYDFAPVGYLSLDARGVIHEINLTGAILLGRERARITGTPFSNFLERGEKIKFFNHISQVFRSSGNVINELQLQRSGGTTTTIQMESRSFGVSAGEGRLCRTIITDISERKRWEDELLKAKEQAETASQAKTRFLSRMSHELRTPLNAILGFTQIMEMSEDNTTIAEHRDSINTILHSGWHLLRIINDVLNLASIEANKVDLDIENVSVEECIQNCIEIILPLARERDIVLKYSESGCKDFLVRADPFRLKQVLLNLVANAVKYNRDGGSVTVHCEAVHPGRIRIAVSDTGSGIREEDMPSLFHSFSRLPKRSYSVQGAGIGLSISKQLTELMGGAIGVESVYGQGSTFWIEIPAASGSPQAKHKRPENHATPSVKKSGQFTLLYVEDSPSHIQLLEAVVEDMPGIRLLTAHMPTLGLELAQAHQPDLILLDIDLPGMNGFEVLGQLYAGEATREIPVIAISANAMPADVEKGLLAGFRRYITKPFNIAEFKEAVDEILRPGIG